MYKRISIFLLIAAMLIAMAACGKQKEQSDAQKPSETVASTEKTKPSETENAAEETKATEVMIEYSMPEGEGVESVEEFVGGEDQDVSEETQEAAKPAEMVPPVVFEKEECNCEYSNYLKMSPAEQEEYMNTFASPLDFIEWSKNALAEHEAHDTTVQASGGDLDLSDYIK